MKKTLLLLAVLLLLLPAACTPAPASAGPVRVRLCEVTRSVFYAPQYIADALGFFRDEGLAVDITTAGGSEKAMTALIAGEADICLAGPETGVYLVNEGKQDHPVIVGQLTKRDGAFLIAREPMPDFQWSDLVGKTVIGGRAGGMPIMTLRYVMAQNGLNDGENCTIIDSIQFNLMAGAFEGGEGDFVTLFEPTATEFQNAGKGFIVTGIGRASGEVPYTCYFVNPAQKDSETTLAFLRAIRRAQTWLVTASDREAAEAMQPYFPDTSLDSLMIVARAYRDADAWMTSPEMDESAYARLLDIMEFNGVLSARPAFAELVDNAPAQRAGE